MEDKPILVLMCSGLAMRWAKIGVAKSIDDKIFEGIRLYVEGRKIHDYIREEGEKTEKLADDKVYVVQSKSGRLEVCDPDRVKNLAWGFPKGPRLIEYNMAEFKDGGGKEVVLVVSQRNKHHFEDVFGKDHGKWNPYKDLYVRYAYQCPNMDDIPKGTVEAALAAYDITGGCTTIVCNGDDTYPGAFKELLKSENQPTNGMEIVTLGYKLGKVIPKESKGHAMAILMTDEHGKLKDCVEHDNLVWTETGKIKDAKTGEEFEPEIGASMNIMHFGRDAYRRMLDIHEFAIPYGNPAIMKRMFGRNEFLLPNFLAMVTGYSDITCRVVPFSGERFGLTYPSDLNDFGKAVIQFYHGGDPNKPIW